MAEGETAPDYTELDCLFTPQVISEVGRLEFLKANGVKKK